MIFPSEAQGRKFTVAGRVIDKNERPMKKVRVKLFNNNGRKIAEEITSSKGKFKFKKIKKGTYVLRSYDFNGNLTEIKSITLKNNDLDLLLKPYSSSDYDLSDEPSSKSKQTKGNALLHLTGYSANLETTSPADERTYNPKRKSARDIAKSRYPKLFEPKDEFETTSEYNKRLEERLEIVNKVEQELIKEQQVKKIEKERLAQEKEEKKNLEKDRQIAESLDTFEVGVSSLGSYDADKEAFSYLSIKIPKIQNYKKKKVDGYVMRWDAKKIIRGGLFQYEYSHENRMLNIYGTVESATKLDEKDIVATIDYDYNFVIKENNLGLAEDIVKLDIRYMNLETTKKDTIDWDLIKVPDIKIPRSQARDFKKEYSSAKVVGYKRLAHKRVVRISKASDFYVTPYGLKHRKMNLGEVFKHVETVENGYWYKVKAKNGVEGYIANSSGTVITSLTGGYDYFNMYTIHPITGSKFIIGPQKDIYRAPMLAKKKSIVPPDLSMKVAFIESNGNGFLDAEENGKVKVSISNSGKGSAMGVFVELKPETSNKNISSEKSKVIGQIHSGETKTIELNINAFKSVSKMMNRFTVSATESYGFPPDPMQISFETFPFIPPKLNLVDFGISTPNERNEIRPQTTTEVQARIQNEGQGPAEHVQFSVNLPKGVYFTPESRQEYSFSTLKPSEFKDLEFSFNTSKEVSEIIPITIGFTEGSSSGFFPMNLEVQKPQKTIQQLIVTGKELSKVDIVDVATISVDVEKDIPITGRNGEDDLAVVFGIENYKNVPGVSFAKRDAMYIKKYFESVLGIPNNRIYFKTDSDVTLAEFNLAFGGWLKRRLNKNTNVFIYYAGHGAPDLKQNKAYLIPYDGDPDYAADTGFEMDKLYEQVSDLGAASVTVFLDACFTGANRNNEMLLADARPVFMEVDATATGNVTVFSASGGKEISSAWPEKKHGLFSYYLMKGMRGDADENKDNKITIGELGDYVRENVSDMAGMLDREQTPSLQTIDEKKVLISF